MNGFMNLIAARSCGLSLLFAACLLVVLASCSEPSSTDADQNGGTASSKTSSSVKDTDQLTAVGGPFSSWISARGNDLNTGISTSLTDATQGKEAWTWDAAGRLWQTPVARDGILYVGDGNLDFYAIRIADGKQLWRSRPKTIKTQHTEVAGENENLAERALPKDLDDHYGYSTPVLDHDQVITISEYGVMTSFQIKDGTVLWEYDFEAKVMSSPRIRGNKILVSCTDGHFFAFDKTNGTELWRYWTSAEMLGSSCAFLGSKTIVFPGHDRILHFVDLETGEAQERVDVGKISASTPLVAFGCLYFTIQGDGLCCYDLVEKRMRWKKSGPRAGSHSLALSGDNILIHARNDLLAFHGVTGELSWKTPLSGRGAVAPCVGPKLIYVSSNKATLYAIEPQTGAIKWERSFGESSRCHPILVDGLVIVSNFKGRMTAFK